ncbi:GNAT family N-acetyltransferase [Pseudomonas kielensis]|uniref:GNAT family N-acetyltransferase n=1 Tax=Pseudomonas kielensis TaxID=2762577 RepID=A0A7X1GCC8_9PSED|nr:GNAT family N-acetyltransferase [Pseudomonas kielensis]MBC2689796.1 GNAT family N-acetyltransferase [Pseudomonas kielensis]
MIAIIMKPAIRYKLFSEMSVDFIFLAKHLSAVAGLYPGFKEWLYFTFKPEFARGVREVIVAYSGNEIAGLALLKRTSVENKICTFYVFPSFRDNDIGKDLIDRSISFLDNGREMMISVSEEREAELFPLLRKSGFKLHYKIEDLYRIGKSESFYRL